MELEEIRKQLVVPPGKKISLLNDYNPRFKAEFLNKESAQSRLEQGIEELTKLQDTLYAESKHALLIIFQAMDAAGKDGTIKHVMSGLNPQGCQVFSFKAPSVEELDHDYLWRTNKALPERGRIGIFNRSYYEELLIVRVHPELLQKQQLPDALNDKKIWKRRFEEIRNYEQYLTNNGVVVLKFFLNVSKGEQKKRFLERINEPDKNWKFSPQDVKERAHWDAYLEAYEDVFNNTSTEFAPWFVIPADTKWFTRLMVADTIVQTMRGLNLSYPKVNEEQRGLLQEAKLVLESE
mgnify:CR=1 FL=1